MDRWVTSGMRALFVFRSFVEWINAFCGRMVIR